MNYRQKCKTKGKWAFVKYSGNGAIYAVCQNCIYTYPCYTAEGTGYLNIKPGIPHKYCPNCGLKMSLFDGYKVFKEGIDF